MLGVLTEVFGGRQVCSCFTESKTENSIKGFHPEPLISKESIGFFFGRGGIYSIYGLYALVYKDFICVQVLKTNDTKIH